MLLARRRGPTHSEKYKAHIASPEWARIRKGALERAGNSCALCGRGIKDLRRKGLHLEVHHKHYRNLGREQPEDLTVLCAGRGGCHSLADEVRRAAAGRKPAARGRARRRRSRGGSGLVRELRPVWLFLVGAGVLKIAAVVLPHV
jgi:5-methylcytosine-specific restriction endonuclease McrA